MTKTDFKLTAKELDAQLRLRKAPITERLPLRIVAVAKWIAVTAGLVFIAGCACFPVARMIDPAAEISADAPTTASAILICGAGVCIFCLAMGLFALLIRLAGAWDEMHLREFKQGIYYARWTCSKDEWQDYIDYEIYDLRGWPLACTIFCSFFGLTLGLCSLSSWSAQTPTSTIYLTAVGIFFGFMATGWILGKFIQWCNHKSLSARRGTPEVAIIGLSGFYFNKRFHDFKTIGRRLRKFKFSQQGELHLFEFQFKLRVENGDDYHDVRIPIPATKLREADAVYWMIRCSAGLDVLDEY